MGNGKKGGAAALLGVFEDIEQRLAAITPEQFSAPAQEREEGAHAIATATDHIKRLHTLRVVLEKERCDLARAGLRVILDSKGMIGNAKTREAMFDAMRQTAERAREKRVAMEQLEKLGDIVDKVFWLEIIRQYPDLAEKPVVAIYNDWSLCWKDTNEGETDADDIGNALLQAALLPGLLGLKELLSGDRRR